MRPFLIFCLSVVCVGIGVPVVASDHGAAAPAHAGPTEHAVAPVAAHGPATLTAAPGLGHGATPAANHAHAPKNKVSTRNVWKELKAGNDRYVAGLAMRPRQDARRREETGQSQKPLAIVLTCSDSRVPPELLFDQGIGDLFVIRVAGNVVDDFVLGSVEYAAEHLGVSLVVVLGHERCGAVSATVKGGEAPGHIGPLIEAIKPSVELARDQRGDVLENAINNNIRAMVKAVRESLPILAHLGSSGRLTVVGALYDLDTGKVEEVR